MERQNVTLSIPKDILKKARILAVEQETSLSALLTRTLSDIVDRHERYDTAQTTQVALLEKGFNLGTGGQITWERETLHER